MNTAIIFATKNVIQLKNKKIGLYVNCMNQSVGQDIVDALLTINVA